MTATLTEQEQFQHLRLLRSKNVGPVSYRQLLRRFGSAAAALDALPDLARRGGNKAFAIASEAQIEAEFSSIKRAGANLLFLNDPAYPNHLGQLSNAPPVLIYRGRAELLQKPCVAIVGARNSSAAACRFARQIASDLVAADAIVVSGLARGIDTAAHNGAGAANSIAVIAGGIDVVFPPENAELQEEIARNGLLLSEHPPGTQPTARHFPFRNRIIAGLGYGTLVVEAAMRSGSLITARLAGEFGREVMAVPGSPLDPRSKGCNELIRNGATLIQDAAEVVEAISPFDPAVAAGQKYELFEDDADFAHFPDAENEGEGDGQDRDAFINLIGMAPVAVVELIRQSGISAGLAQLILIELELAGRLERHAGGKVSLRPE